MKILNFGSLNRDLVYSVPHAVRPGETLSSTGLEVFCGGKGLNQSIAFARAGAEVWHAGCIGPDGGAIVSVLEKSGVKTKYLKTVSSPTGHAVIQLDVNGQNSILLDGGANRKITEEQVDLTLTGFSEGDMLVLQNEVSCVPYMMRKAYEKKMRIVWNPSPFSRSLLSYPLETVSYFVVNEIEGAELAGAESPEKIISVMRSSFPESGILLTLGSRGAVYSDKNGTVSHGCFDVKPVDTTGAGDTFLGYFFSAFDRLGAEGALRLATGASSLAITVKGAATSIPVISDVLKFLEDK